MKAEIQRAKNANSTARRVVERLIDEENMGCQTRALLLAKLAAALGENYEALTEVEKIVQNAGSSSD
jgi:phytoene/squalene synthetase